tara:strand:- start:2524 stop:3195 length:672 start_codon:yes stop_codon:yes gene_type:complete
MHQRKSKKILVYFFLLIIVSSISNSSINEFKLNKTKNINISGLDQKNNQNLINEIKNLSLGSIFFINKNEIEKLINSNSLVEKYVVFKKYPSTINIEIKKTSFFGKLNKDGKTFLIGSNGKLTLYESNYKELPFIFGKPNVNEFLKFKKVVEKSKFSYAQIKDLYFFPSKRWDLKLKDNILLRLPRNSTKETLNYLYDFLDNYEGKKIITIDARIENKIILNE